MWKGLSAATSGVPVDFTQLLADANLDDLVGLNGLWLEFQKEREEATA